MTPKDYQQFADALSAIDDAQDYLSRKPKAKAKIKAKLHEAKRQVQASTGKELPEPDSSEPKAYISELRDIVEREATRRKQEKDAVLALIL